MSKKIFLTGATGNIGTHIVQNLQNDNIDFTIGVTNQSEELAKFNPTIINFADKKSMLKAFEDVETLFLLFPLIDPIKQFAKNAIDAAKEAGVKHIVRSGLASANVNSEYDAFQLHGEIDEMLMQSGINYTITQPRGFMQNFINFLSPSIKNGIVYYSTGEGEITWVDTRDIGAVNAEILKNPNAHINKTYIISGSETFSIPDGVDRIGKALNQSINKIPISHAAASETMKSYGMSDFVVNMIGSIERATEEGAAKGFSDDVEKILGRPPISFNQFVQDHIKAWQ